MDVRSASDSFVGVVTVGLNTSPSWYSDGSLIKRGDYYFPFDQTNKKYYDYINHELLYWDSVDGTWFPDANNPTVFDQVPADFLTYLQSGNFTLVQRS